MSERSCDLVVIGAGPGGYVAAVRGAQYGLDTVLVEKDDRLGGTCGLRGCIPTKALIQSARTWEPCRKGARTFGVTVGEAAFAQTRPHAKVITPIKGCITISPGRLLKWFPRCCQDHCADSGRGGNTSLLPRRGTIELGLEAPLERRIERPDRQPRGAKGTRGPVVTLVKSVVAIAARIPS